MSAIGSAARCAATQIAILLSFAFASIEGKAQFGKQGSCRECLGGGINTAEALPRGVDRGKRGGRDLCRAGVGVEVISRIAFWGFCGCFLTPCRGTRTNGTAAALVAICHCTAASEHSTQKIVVGTSHRGGFAFIGIHWEKDSFRLNIQPAHKVAWAYFQYMQAVVNCPIL